MNLYCTNEELNILRKARKGEKLDTCLESSFILNHELKVLGRETEKVIKKHKNFLIGLYFVLVFIVMIF